MVFGALSVLDPYLAAMNDCACDYQAFTVAAVLLPRGDQVFGRRTSACYAVQAPPHSARETAASAAGHEQVAVQCQPGT